MTGGLRLWPEGRRGEGGSTVWGRPWWRVGTVYHPEHDRGPQGAIGLLAMEFSNYITGHSVAKPSPAVPGSSTACSVYP